MNLLIADDEYLVRASLKSMLSELDIQIDGICEASDGEELMRKAVQKKPDLVFVDIKMPKMDGLESIRNVKAQCPDTCWIILTGFPVFEYAKEAIDLGVERYLLKPTSKDELEDAIKAVLKNKEESLAKRNLEFSNDLSTLINNYATADCLQKSNVIFSDHFIGAVIFLDGDAAEDGGLKSRQKLWSMSADLQKKYIGSAVRIAFIKMPQESYLTVFAWDPLTIQNGRQLAESCLIKLDEISQALESDGCRMSILCGNECDSFAQLQSTVWQIQKLAPLRFILPKTKYIGLEYLLKQQKTLSPQMLKTAEAATDILRKYENGLYGEYIKAVELLEGYFSANRINLSEVQPLVSFLKCCCLENCPSEQGLKSFFDVLKENGFNKLNQTGGAGDLVERTIVFINNNYMRDIGIAQIASELNVTPNYLSALFHKKTGENFMCYLTKTRLLNAREILRRSDSPQVNQVAKQVGYYTVNYFTKLYKKYFGICPSEETTVSAIDVNS